MSMPGPGRARKAACYPYLRYDPIVKLNVSLLRGQSPRDLPCPPSGDGAGGSEAPAYVTPGWNARKYELTLEKDWRGAVSRIL